ncbi:DUF4998 domain-containing protein [Fodinibius salsisoli]|uniref:DUF5013 domain-containing protein n=1 Tax=Fodinibius salsisoli TaxID=2820877 RepID=A0ABT3PQH9_9BACT|nr:DUF4998 domain-containing protein [Fodinibius salsisoli]MCW9708122.1 DUF5013 domain-containing protein [Fodinibius salsisoli]
MKIMIAKGYILVIALVLGLAACSDMYQHEKYIEDGERTYTGKADSVKVHSGENRVLIEGLLISDPKITGAKISWNAGRDSITVPIERTSGIDTLQIYIEDLEEKVYNFEIVTHDEQGNTSVPVNISGEVYGEKYQASLLNRPVKNKELYAGNLNTTVEFGSMDLSSGVFATQIRYTDSNGQMQTKIVPVDSSDVKLPNYKIGDEFEYRTMFLPEPTSIDTFYTEYEADIPQVTYLKNYSVPFEASSTSGRWGILADWTTNDAIRIHDDHGGWDEWNSNIFNVESGWGAPGITNGKIYQTVTLSPGTYTFKANLRNGNDTSNEGEGDYAYLVVAEGDILPDVDDGAIENDAATIGYSRILQSKDPEDFKVEFTINQQQEVSVGYATTQPGGNVSEQYPGTSNGRHCNIMSFEFFKHGE